MWITRTSKIKTKNWTIKPVDFQRELLKGSVVQLPIKPRTVRHVSIDARTYIAFFVGLVLGLIFGMVIAFSSHF